MSLLSVKNLTCVQSIKTLFEDATFSIDAKDKIAVIGPNGCGKTTLLSLLAQATSDPAPQIATKNGLRITFLPQTVEINPEHSILDHLFQSKTPAAQAIRNYQEVLEAYNDNPTPEIEEKITEAMSQMDYANAWDYEAKVSSILRELNIHHLSQKLSELSGGMKKKISLAQAFFEESDLLILDEPTNHLDIITIEWLEDMLKRHNSALIMVTHDRYFLDKVCNKILEIDQKKMYTYIGNYQNYLEQREERYLSLDKQEKSIQSVLRVELAWLRKGPKARSTKQKARKQRISELVSRPQFDQDEALDMNVSERRLGKKILELTEVSKSFDDRVIINNFSHIFKQGERIGILGPNGAGKTTLLNLIMGRLTPDSGVIDPGINTLFGYFDQHSQSMDPDMTIYEHIGQIGTQITYHDGTTLSAAKLLERFLFPGSMLKTQISKLSGGEKRRLHLVSLLLENPNFLLFDEPTNDLDIQTLSVLEDFLTSFKGCILIISHDRYFMDRVIDRLFVFRSGGSIKSYAGSYTDYSDALKDFEALKKKQYQQKSKSETPAPYVEKRRLTYKENEEMKKLESDITTLETEKESLNALFLDASKTAKDFEIAGKRLKEVTDLLTSKNERWECLAEFA